MSVKQYMIANVSLLPGRLSITNAMARLASESYGVVVREIGGTPLAVVKGTDLASLKDKGARTLMQAIKHLGPPLIIGSQIEMKTVANVVLEQMRRKASGIVYVPQTVILDKTGVVGIVPDIKLIDAIEKLPGVEIKRGVELFKGQIRLGPTMGFRQLNFGGGAGGGGGPVGPPPQTGLGGTGRSIEIMCAEPGCGYVNTLFRVPNIGSKKRCQNPEPPPHQLRLGR